MTRALIAFWFFTALGFAIFGKIWIDAYAIAPKNPQSEPATFQTIHYWKTYRKHYPKSYLTEACVGCAIVALLIMILGPFFLS
jgi:uncharacterized membrane protein YesL